MKRAMKTAGLQPIQFEFGNFFTAIFKRTVHTKNGVENGTISGKIVDMKAFKKIEQEILNGAVFGAVKEATIDRLQKVLYALDEMSFLKISHLVVKSGIPRRTLQRDLALLKENRLVVLKGSPKTGGYVLTEKGKKLAGEIEK